MMTNEQPFSMLLAYMEFKIEFGSLGSDETVIVSNIASDFFMQVGEPEMVETLKETDLPEPWFGNKSRAPLAQK